MFIGICGRIEVDSKLVEELKELEGFSLIIALCQLHQFGKAELSVAPFLDGTPLLDIKPYVPEFDHPNKVRTG